MAPRIYRIVHEPGLREGWIVLGESLNGNRNAWCEIARFWDELAARRYVDDVTSRQAALERA